jgi:uncharacterized protein (DUF488 family)
MKIWTIGFTKKTAEKFFSILRGSGARRVVDVRLNNVSQLAGFAKRDDLKFFLKEICGMVYVHEPLLAPTQDILDRYRKAKGDWREWEKEFSELIRKRKIEKAVEKKTLEKACLLCSEETPEHCHRRLVAEYLREKWRDVEIVHL